MAQSYRDRKDVLFLNPSLPANYFREKYVRRCILIPMRRCKVLVPYPKDSSLNLFQETILKLLQSGAKDNAWLSQALSLDVSLVDVIIKELITRKYITKGRLVTDAGRLILADELANYEMKTGYIFYNYVTNTYMDAFLTDEEMNVAGIRRRIPDDNRIQFFLDDSVENSRYENGIIIRVNEPNTAIKPSPYDIMGVCKRQKNRARMLFAGDYREAKENITLMPKNIEKIKLLDNNADVFVATYLALPTNDLVNKSNLQVCYPFGEGLAMSMLPDILREAKREENRPLSDVIEELKNSQTQLSAEEMAGANRASAETVKRVQAILSKNIINHPYMYEMALDAEGRRERIIEMMTNKGSNWEAINAEINRYIISNYNLTVAILIDCADRFNYYNLDLLSRSKSHNAEHLSVLAEKCGFTDETNVFRRFLSIFKGHVASAIQKEELNALIALNLLEADAQAEHPFYKLGEQMTDFISQAYWLKTIRSEGMHGNDIEYNFQQMEVLSRFNFEVAHILTEDLIFDESKMNINDDKDVDESQIKIRKDAENQVEKLFTDNIYRYSGLSNLLVSLMEEEIRQGNSYPSRVSAVLEFVLKELCGHRMSNRAAANIQEFDQAYGQQLTSEMKRYGFSVTRAPYYNSRGISKSFSNYRMGTLGTNFYVWYLSEGMQPDCMLSELGKKCPQLIKLVDEAIQTREHKGRMAFEDQRLSFLKENFKDSLNELIDIMVYRGLY